MKCVLPMRSHEMIAMDGSHDLAHAHTAWTPVCAVADIPRLGARVLMRPDDPRGNVAIFRTGDDRVFALADRCPHKGGVLSQGIVHGESVTCPLHNWVINLTDGNAAEPDEGCVHVVQVRLEGRRILLAVSA